MKNTNIVENATNQALHNKAEAKKASLQIKKTETKIDEARSEVLMQINVIAGLTYNPVIQQSLLEFGGERTKNDLRGSYPRLRSGEHFLFWYTIMFHQIRVLLIVLQLLSTRFCNSDLYFHNSKF